MRHCWSHTGWPGELLSTDHMDVEVEDTLAALSTFIDDCAVALFSQAFLRGNFGNDSHQMTQKCGMSLLSLADSSETVAVFGNDQEVLRGNWCNISEGQALLIFEDDVSGDLFTNNFVEDCILNGVSVCHITGENLIINQK